MRLGSDPETFLVDNTGNPISAIGYINADKWNPMQIPDMPAGFTLQEDNVSLEYGIPPATSADEFVAHIQAVMQKSLDYLPGLSFSKLSCIIFPREQMNTPGAHVFGCEPDFNAWTKEANMKPNPPHPFMRSAGGHIHIETAKDAYTVGQACDLFLGVPSILMDATGGPRRELYGKHGAIRPKPYGVEYRTLSNFWIFDEKYIRWAWRNAQRAVDNKMDLSVVYEKIVQAIDFNDKAVAQQLVDQFNLEVV